ncbi:type VI secretion system tip protein VgrG [Halosquirtibacter laminarini]|uniref:Type VI secretion system tip protein VgrG n=1 Tax=Halosquirtibacter laminarini TaxID=3374600 RepID=A0AC61NFJ1_9BACT|nr:type VI secretion system tip protein VgrG [Prolixibacteraceae bacterium]
MADSPYLNSSGNIKYIVYSEGKAIHSSCPLTSLFVCNRINYIPYATLVFCDGDVSRGQFELLDSSIFNPGKKVKVEVGYGNTIHSVFEGVVVKCALKVRLNGSQLIVECKDEAVKLTIGRRSVNFVDSSDAETIKKMISNVGLSADVDITTTKHEQLIQYNVTDWDFILSRAEVNGLQVIVHDGHVIVKKPETNGDVVLTIEYGKDIIDLDAEVDSQYQIKSVSAMAWNSSEQKMIEQKGTAPSLNKVGDFTKESLSKIAAPSELILQSGAELDDKELKAWADAQLLKSGMSMITGSVTFHGNTSVLPGTLIELKKVGKHFEGKVYVTGVTHEIMCGKWITVVNFGLPPQWFVEREHAQFVSASGLLPSIGGLQIGKVMTLEGDPKQEFRVQVKIPNIHDESEGVWARLANFYATSGKGLFFIPEVNDEVVLGFLNDDPRHPVVLGVLYSGKHPMPEVLKSENSIKMIQTREDLKLEFDDENKKITLTTVGQNKVVLNDKEKSILLHDQNGNKITLSDKGIVFDSPKDVKVISKGSIILDAMKEVCMTSKKDIHIDGLNVNASAKIKFVAAAKANAELSANGQTMIKGAVVMIN